MWHPELAGAPPARQVISVFSLLEIQLVPHTESDKLDFILVLQRPNCLPWDPFSFVFGKATVDRVMASTSQRCWLCWLFYFIIFFYPKYSFFNPPFSSLNCFSDNSIGPFFSFFIEHGDELRYHDVNVLYWPFYLLLKGRLFTANLVLYGRVRYVRLRAFSICSIAAIRPLFYVRLSIILLWDVVDLFPCVHIVY